ncbi:MAG: dynamin family protein [Thermodesulfobacteriota bacterium]|nr:dynamin family protein [Thermodesulfobacteriota bacterium]
MDEKKLQNELQNRVQQKLLPLFTMYGMDYSDLESDLKWKPLILMIGNYSSGKSTLINELLGQDLQRTGQAPTDDSFTLITSDGPEKGEGEIPGSVLVNDETLPFECFKAYGEQFISHFRLKRISVPFLENMALIDTPGMLDAVTEKDRGYDYMTVIREFAKLADLIVLMFDPHKAGTIKETYTVIRDTLPESSTEDRIVFVMSRIDECDNFSDLVHSYGTLCWNLSQMTGRKDIPHIFLTYSPAMAAQSKDLSPWSMERDQLKEKILTAPRFRINHILQNIDRQVNELQLINEAMAAFSKKGRELLVNVAKFWITSCILAFFFIDIIISKLAGFPKQTFIEAMLSGSIDLSNLIIPISVVVMLFLLSSFWFIKWSFPRFAGKWKKSARNLVNLNTQYKSHLWTRVEEKVEGLLETATIKELEGGHIKNLNKIRTFIQKDLQEFYNKIR